MTTSTRDDAPTTSRDRRARSRRTLIVSSSVLAIASLLSLFVGVVNVAPWSIFEADTDAYRALVIARIPRLIALLLAGSSLAVAGVIMQQVTRNRFVSPTTAGTVESAVLGIVLATMWFPANSLLVRMLVAIATSLLGTFVFIRILRRIRIVDIIVVPLLGLMFAAVVSAITVFLAYRYDLLQLVDTWTTGSFSRVLRGRYEPLYAVLIGGVVAYVFAARFTVVGMGENFAVNLGINYHFVLNLGLVIASVNTAVVVVVVGAIPFLGLIVPNVISMWAGDNLQRTLPLTALAGAGFVLVCDVLGRVVRRPYEIPTGTIAGIVGAVVFIALILRARTDRT
ncbi:ABC transporter permease [Ilumatobacter nonamiensis]|uniref:ABC transporter permease n=1 Tax=Ilumatobacter nonamiensis TaxID=467093 RepID=UPI000344B619|nr:iron chelate uptake ABC transporter family permease subunit [Ilumatobacter nonamiensis]